jgi:GTP-binding protein
MKFVDEVKINVQAGDGGRGCVSFRREKFVPRGGPDGGDGGDGGSVFLIGKRQLQTLYDLQVKPHYRAGQGGHGMGKGMDGRSGKDEFISVPLGAVVMQDGEIMGEILKDKAVLRVAAGGEGGRGNRHFASSTNRAPRKAEPGKPGEKRLLKILLKLISQVGLVGFPNAGKSTLLRALTNAKPRVADYPFTTLTPNLGVLKDSFKSVVIADMPGIIEGAHAGKGLGLQFLRHIERAQTLVLLIDASADRPLEQYNALLSEFGEYSKELLKKKRCIVFNKIDLLDQVPRFDLPERVFCISALKGTGIKELSRYLVELETKYAP